MRKRNIQNGFWEHAEVRMLYRRWHQMVRRCLNPKNDRFKYYGGRGITVCKRWLSFPNFYEDVIEGFRPELTLERRDNSKGYSPGNCHWATWTVQQNNKRNNRRLTFNGKTLTVPQWAKMLSMPAFLIHARIGYGWPIEEILDPNRFTERKGQKHPNCHQIR